MIQVIGPGLFCGFMTTPTVGLNCYFLVVASFFIKDNRRRVTAMAGFVTGQFIMFTSVYNRALHNQLFQLHRIILFFGAFFLLQFLWTGLTTLRKWPLLDPNNKTKRVVSKRKRVVRRQVFLQLEFILNFFLQLKFPYIEPDSMIRPLVDSYLKDEAKKILFVRSCLSGWLIGHVIFMIFFFKFFGLVGHWVGNIRKLFHL